MKSTIVVGLQWGDEGKGKIIDYLAGSFDYVVRFNGGNNAGHTVVVGDQKYPLSIVPSGVVQKKKLLISQGVVINPKVLLAEIKMLKDRGLAVNLTIDPRAQVVMPYHQEMDAANEAWKGKAATGSLHLGIGYCYEDRNNRSGIRMEDLVRPEIFVKKVSTIFPLKKAIIEKAYGYKSSLNLKKILQEYLAYGKILKKYLGDVSVIINNQIGKCAFLFEQAHGTMLDPVFGTYPYTVAPPTLASSVYTAVGIPARVLPVIGVVKAYTTRVGNGPFPTELTDEIGAKIRKTGKEFGTVSKRPRRIGWLDLPLLRYGIRLNGVTSLAVTKLDVLSGFKSLLVCTGYKLGKNLVKEFPSQINDLPNCIPVYKKLAGWNETITGIKSFKKLPINAQKYLKYIEKELKCPIKYLSNGPDRKELITL